MSIHYLPQGKQLNVAAEFIAGPGKVHIIETESGDFCYPNGVLVCDRGHLSHLPRGYRERAMEWFDKKYGEKVKKAESQESAAKEMVIQKEEQDEGIGSIPGLAEEMERLG